MVKMVVVKIIYFLVVAMDMTEMMVKQVMKGMHLLSQVCVILVYKVLLVPVDDVRWSFIIDHVVWLWVEKSSSMYM